MKVLGIESSCDETSAAVVTDRGEVLSNVVSSQVEQHAPYGGVVPELAARAHLRAIIPVIERALLPLPNRLGEIDAIAFTQGPGLIGALLVGVQAAKAIAFARDIPMIGVDHLLGHLFAVFLRTPDADTDPPKLPFLALLVSGGHTALYEVRDIDKVTLLGQTRDDAAGEAYDKVAKMLGLGYPGGPVIDALSKKGDPRAVLLPRPMAKTPGLDFSFSGLKTAVAHVMRARGDAVNDQVRADVCASFQQAVTDVLIGKSRTALEQRGLHHWVITGGVAANSGLRAAAKIHAAEQGLQLFIPPLRFCTDNAAMIAYAGARLLAKGNLASASAAAFSRSNLGQPLGAACEAP
ncbi:MAG: tRNA (adenosine(37)-N6)-threonylcarbamoyltransferase complex transferase subunit TsaD [Myxococcales bacterium]|nr:tRNA (adenosine(37)-N6)-threonylcarbamoyltransferase complex transferase subunit TsaD [Myxococcales bacterium]